MAQAGEIWHCATMRRLPQTCRGPEPLFRGMDHSEMNRHLPFLAEPAQNEVRHYDQYQ